MPEKVNFSVGTTGNHAGAVRRLIEESQQAGLASKPFRNRPNIELTLKECIQWIKDQEYEDYIELGLVKAVSKYPHSALIKFFNNLPNQISRIKREKRTVEKRSVEHKKEKGVEDTKKKESSEVNPRAEFTSADLPSGDDF